MNLVRKRTLLSSAVVIFTAALAAVAVALFFDDSNVARGGEVLLAEGQRSLGTYDAVEAIARAENRTGIDIKRPEQLPDEELRLASVVTETEPVLGAPTPPKATLLYTYGPERDGNEPWIAIGYHRSGPGRGVVAGNPDAADAIIEIGDARVFIGRPERFDGGIFTVVSESRPLSVQFEGVAEADVLDMVERILTE